MKPNIFKVLVLVVTFAVLTIYPGNTHAQTTEHCGTLTNETWAAADNVHVVTCDVTIPAGVTLTIEEGAIVKFGDDDDIIVNGKLVAQGTQTDPIYFTSSKDDSIGGDTNGDGTASVPAVGDWGAIIFNAGSDDSSIITRSVIRYSGASGSTIDDGAIYLTNASPQLSYITFTDNYINGVEINDVSWETDTWDNTTIVYMIEEGHWTNVGDYNFSIATFHTLTISPGMKIKLGNEDDIIVNGELVAVGTITDPIYFSSKKDDILCGVGAFDEPICDTNGDGISGGAKGDWGAINFGSDSDDNSIITRSVIRYSGTSVGSTIDDGAIYLTNASPQLSYITFTDNYINGVEIASGTWTTDTWDNTTIVHVLEEGDITVPAANTLTSNPGMKIKFGTGADIRVDGMLTVPGTSDAPVYFSSRFDDTLCGVGAFDEDICDTHDDGTTVAPDIGDWGHIVFNDGSNDNSLIKQAIFHYSGGAAIALSSASPTIERTLFADNYRGIEALSGSVPTLVCNDIHDNTNYGIYNNTPATIVMAEGHWWGDASGPTHAGNPGGTGQSVSDGVDYDPWKTSSCLEAGIDATKQVNADLAVPGDVLTYTIVVAETNDNLASNVSVSDPIPVNTTYVPGSAAVNPPGSGTLTPTTNLIEWRGPVEASSSITLTFKVTVASDLTLDTTIANNATVSFAPQPDISLSANTDIDAQPPHSTVTSPVDGAILSGVNYLIMGTSTDGTAGVAQVEINTEDGLGWQSVAGTTSWSYDWSLPADGAYTLTSRATDSVNHVETPSTGPTVIVDNTPPTSTITTPVDGEFITSTSYLISGLAQDNLSGVDSVYISTNNGSSWSTASGTTTWGHLWNMPGEDNVTHILESRAQDKGGNLESTSVVTVTVDNVSPTSVILDPFEGQILDPTTVTYLVSGIASDGSGITKVEVSTDNGTSWQPAVGTTTWVYTWTLPITDGIYILHTRATDGAQNVEILGAGLSIGVGQSQGAVLNYLPIILKH